MAFEQCGNDSVPVFKRVLQTCSIGEVVSFNAVFDCDIHRLNSFLGLLGPRIARRHSV